MRRLLPSVVLCVIAVVACSDDGPEDSDVGATDAPSPSAPFSSDPSVADPPRSTTAAPALPRGLISFSGQGNDLIAYDLDGNRRVVIANARDDPDDGRDVNGQICFLDDRTLIAGEDTGQPEITPGWGVFTLEGDTLEELSATQIGKLVPTYQPADSSPEMFGCGVLPDGRVVLTDVGNQAFGNGTGQLMMFFPPDGGWSGEVTEHCKLDTTIATAQQVAIDSDDVLVASARPPTVGVWRYSDLPASVDECGREPAKDLFIDPGVAPDGEQPVGISNGIAPSGSGTWYVSSIITGRIAEYDADGTFLRTILAPPGGEVLGESPYSTGTPNGLGVTADGTLWYADLGLVFDGGFGPGPSTGSVRIIRFVDGEPQPPETIDDGLRFPDAIGVLPGGDQ